MQCPVLEVEVQSTSLGNNKYLKHYPTSSKVFPSSALLSQFQFDPKMWFVNNKGSDGAVQPIE